MTIRRRCLKGTVHRVALSLFQRAAFLTVGIAMTATGCSQTESGTLEVAWQLDGSTFDASCKAADAETVLVTVSDAYGNRYKTREFTCTDFSGSIAGLSVGDHQVEAELLDTSGELVSAVVGPTDVIIEANEAASVLLNFDDESLFRSSSSDDLEDVP